MDKNSIVKEWLNFANIDISCAKYLLGMCPVPLEIICYHCEQAAEKMIKGYLIYKDVEPPRTHDLRLLCKICVELDETFEVISQACINLTTYGVNPRYPFEIEILDIDMQKALEDADYVMNFIIQKLNIIDKNDTENRPKC